MGYKHLGALLVISFSLTACGGGVGSSSQKNAVASGDTGSNSWDPSDFGNTTGTITGGWAPTPIYGSDPSPGVTSAGLIGPSSGPSFYAGQATGNKVTTSSGILDWYVNTFGNGSKTYYFEVKIPFGRVYKSASKVVRTMAPKACEWIDGIQKSDSSAYNGWEIPCGQIMDSNWKQIIDLNVPGQFIQSNGFNITIWGTNLPILFSRSTRQGMYNQLGIEGDTSRMSSFNWGDDIALLYRPGGDNAHVELCVNIPGGEVTAPNRTVYAKAEKWILGVPIVFNSGFNIRPGSASWDYGRACGAADISWKNKGWFTPSVDFSVSTAPYLSNVSYQGLDIQINDWFLQSIDNIMDFFGVSLRRSLISQLSNMGNQVADQDIESGKWFTNTGTDRLLKETTTRLNVRLNDVISRIGLPSSADDLKAILRDRCRVTKLSLSAEWTDRMNTFCTSVIDQLSISIEPFVEDQASRDAGCYNTYANIHETTNTDGSSKWWAEKCLFTARFNVHLGPTVLSFAAEMEKLLRQHIAEFTIPQEWRTAVENSGLGEYGTAILLERLESAGYTQVVPNDWQQQIPTIINQIKAELGQR